ncbi:MAG: hypothetical protein ACLFUG_05710 [Nitriliruptoraceae bacterium]
MLHRPLRLLPLLLAGLLLAACATPEADTPREEDLSGTPGDGEAEGDPQVEPETDTEAGGSGAEEATGDRQRGQDFEGEPLSEAELTSRTSASLGTHLVDGRGRTLYLFTADPEDERTCTDECLETWPVLSTGEELPSVDGEVREELVGTIDADDGALQVTYNGHPLYYYVGDDEVGDAKGQGIEDRWFVVATEGVPVESEPG